ncbi:MAG: hypothetical protein WC531_00545 [Candidatus Paceibacterota bacterium]|jgi:hypothetical protein
MKTKTKIIIGALIIIALAFFGGYKYGQSGSNSNRANGNIPANFMAGAGARRSSNVAGGGGAMVVGQVLSQDATSLTLKLSNGGSRIVLVSTSTDVQKMVKGNLSDLVAGTSVSVNGPTNADGSLTAQSIQLRTP